jgi:hypothetical protein
MRQGNKDNKRIYHALTTQIVFISEENTLNDESASPPKSDEESKHNVCIIVNTFCIFYFIYKSVSFYRLNGKMKH